MNDQQRAEARRRIKNLFELVGWDVPDDSECDEIIRIGQAAYIATGGKVGTDELIAGILRAAAAKMSEELIND